MTTSTSSYRGRLRRVGPLYLLVFVELLEEFRRDGKVVTSSKLLDCTCVSEGSAHDDGLVTVLFVVAAEESALSTFSKSLKLQISLENHLDRLDTRVVG